MIIHLGLPLLTGSSSLPESKRGPRLALPYLALLRAGFTVPPPVTSRGGALLPHRFTLTGNQKKTGGLFSVALSQGHPYRTLSGALLFLQPGLSSAENQSSDAITQATPCAPV